MEVIMINRRLLKNFDFFLLFLTLVLSAYGLVIILSATRAMDIPTPYYYVTRQALGLGVGIVGIFLISLFDYSVYASRAMYGYALVVMLLVAVLVAGRGAGVKRWLDIGFTDIQPSEYAKLFLVILLAKVLSDAEKHLNNRFIVIIPSFIYTMIAVGLVFLQPDLGTAMVLIFILMGMLFAAGVNWRYLAVITGAGLAAMPVLWSYLKDYQKMRLMVFLNPEMDSLESGYQLMQSMIAIGSGSVWGKGLFEGSQVRLRFLPEQHTDFIFSVLGEELGFAGAVALLVLYLILVYRIIWISTQAKDTFGTLVCCGVAIMIVFQILVNIGMTIGIMPVTGLPLPFMSYGGNSLLVNCLAIGLLINVGMRRQKILF